MEYSEAKRILIKDLNDNKGARIQVGMKTYTYNDLVKEVENETPLGKRYINSYIKAMKRLEELNIQTISKKKDSKLLKVIKRLITIPVLILWGLSICTLIIPLLYWIIIGKDYILLTENIFNWLNT